MSLPNAVIFKSVSQLWQCKLCNTKTKLCRKRTPQRQIRRPAKLLMGSLWDVHNPMNELLHIVKHVWTYAIQKENWYILFWCASIYGVVTEWLSEINAFKNRLSEQLFQSLISPDSAEESTKSGKKSDISSEIQSKRSVPTSDSNYSPASHVVPFAPMSWPPDWFIISHENISSCICSKICPFHQSFSSAEASNSSLHATRADVKISWWHLGGDQNQLSAQDISLGCQVT